MRLSKREINDQSDLHFKSNYGKDSRKSNWNTSFVLDFKSAYDSIHREKLLCAMSEFVIPSKLRRLVKTTMTNVQCSVKIQSYLSEPIPTTRGVKQGDALACLLFNIALEKVIRDSGIQTRRTIFFKTVQILAYADDTDLMARTTPGLNEAFLKLEKSVRNMGLIINQ